MSYEEEELMLLDMICESNDEVRNTLYKTYEPVIKGIVKKYVRSAKKLGIDLNDLMQEANVGFTDALNRYDASKDASLKTFVSVCVERRLLNYVYKQRTKKNQIEQESLSLDYDYDQDGLTLKEILKDENADPSHQILIQTQYKNVLNTIKEKLSNQEYEVFSYMLDGLDYLEISKKLNKSPKQVDNTIQRIKTKIKTTFKEEKTMNKKEWLKIIAFLAVFVAFSIVIIRVVSFERQKDDVTIDTPVIDDTKKDEGISFENNSSLEENEIRKLIEEKRENLKQFFEDTKFYKVSEVSKDFTSEDDDNYIVLDTNFFDSFKTMVTEAIYDYYWNQFAKVNKRSDILVKEDLYVAKKGIFDDIYYESAIAINDVTEEKIVLRKATDKEINAYINIKYCEDDNTCVRDELYHFDLIQINDEWLIEDFTTKKN